MSAPDSAVRVLAEGFAFLEAPRWHDGHLYASDFYTRRVLRFDLDGSATTICEVEGQPSGLGFLPDGRMLIVSMLTRQLLVLASDGGLGVYADLSEMSAYPLNDMAVDCQGGAYVGSFGFDAPANAAIEPAAIYYVDPRGRATVAADDFIFPNGIAIDETAKRLYVAETYASQVSVLRTAAEPLDGRAVFVRLGDAADVRRPSDLISRHAVLPDGLAVEPDGSVWVADAAGGDVLRFDRAGHPTAAVPLGGDLAAYAVAVGPARTLFVCAAPPQARRDRTKLDASVLLVVDLDRITPATA